jgi:peptidoglycan/LPS O-acetylase OafA/YrhL
LSHGALGNWIVCAISITLALGLSVLAYHWLELPSIGLGRRLSNSKNLQHGVLSRLVNHQWRKDPLSSARPLEANKD